MVQRHPGLLSQLNQRFEYNLIIGILTDISEHLVILVTAINLNDQIQILKFCLVFGFPIVGLVF